MLQACAYCGKLTDDLHRDHIVPLSRGGPDTPLNYAMACSACNLSKADRTPSEWLGPGRVPLDIAMRETRIASKFATRDRARRSHILSADLKCALLELMVLAEWREHVSDVASSNLVEPAALLSAAEHVERFQRDPNRLPYLRELAVIAEKVRRTGA